MDSKPLIDDFESLSWRCRGFIEAETVRRVLDRLMSSTVVVMGGSLIRPMAHRTRSRLALSEDSAVLPFRGQDLDVDVEKG